jgi:RNA polymerase sigma factor FliA
MTDQREQLILDHLPSIRHIAFRFSAVLPPSVDIRDLVSEGVFGLLAAADRFDPSRGVKFKTYAETRIRGAILDSLRTMDWLPRSLRRRLKKFCLACNQMEQRLGRAPTEMELAAALNLGLADVRELMAIAAAKGEHAPELSDPLSCNEQAGCLIDRRNDALIRVQQAEMRAILAGAIRTLSTRERIVISLYYYDGLTMKEIGKVLGIKESRVSQYHARAKAKLYGRLRRQVSTDPRIWSTLE